MLTIRATGWAGGGTGPEERVAEHVNHQQAEEERVTGDSTCVWLFASAVSSARVTYVLRDRFYGVSSQTHRLHVRGGGCSHVCWADALQPGVCEQGALPRGRQGGRRSGKCVGMSCGNGWVMTRKRPEDM